MLDSAATLLLCCAGSSHIDGKHTYYERPLRQVLPFCPRVIIFFFFLFLLALVLLHLLYRILLLLFTDSRAIRLIVLKHRQGLRDCV